MRVFKSWNYKSLRSVASGYLEVKSPALWRLVSKHKTGVKYVFSGGTAALVDLVVLYALTEIFNVWYLISAIIAFLAALGTSFLLQKFWTFRDSSLKRIKKQIIIYFVIGIANFVLNPTLLYILVEKFRIWYLLSQTLVMGILAIGNYSINKFITFKKDAGHESANVQY